MKLHWQVSLGMALGAGLGLALQFLDGMPSTGVNLAVADSGVQIAALTGAAQKSTLQIGERVTAVVLDHDGAEERLVPIGSVAAFEEIARRAEVGDQLQLVVEGRSQPVPLTVFLGSASPRAKAIAPFAFVGGLFLALLKMLIVPLVFTSIVSGVASIGTGTELRRLGSRTLGYYMASSLVAILVGQLVVNVMQPGTGAQLGLGSLAPETLAPEFSVLEVLQRMVPPNVVAAMSDNSAMLQIIFFAVLLGVFITRTPSPHGPRIKELFDSLVEVMMRIGTAVLRLIPLGVCALLVQTVASTGFGLFQPLLFYMATVVLALMLHGFVVLPLVLRFLGGVSPLAYARAMAPALMTAFSTSSSSMTLPVTLETVEQRGRVSPKVCSFTVPLGATINMDGTALYECIGVIFLAQYYASAGGYELTLGRQGLVVFLALVASVGAAGIPSAGLVMMLTILSALGLPLEGAALLLAIDRPLDMLRTTVNVWSDTVAAAVIARGEGARALGPTVEAAATGG